MKPLLKPFTRVALAGAAVLPILVGMAPQANAADIRDGLKAYYTFDGGVLTDRLGVYDGTARGTNPIGVSAGKDGFGDAITLDGSNYVEITGGAPDDLAFANGSVSIAGWFKVDAFDKSWQALVAKGENNNWRLARRDAEGAVAYAGGATDTPTAPGIDLRDNNWHHIVAISDAAAVNFGTAVYIDGARVSTIAAAPKLTTNGKRVFIGENPDATGRQFKGSIDDLAIWDRVLTDEEITSLYNGGEGHTVKSLFKTQIEILGIGTAALIGGDLTDPENDGVDALGAATDPSWNWKAITASVEPDFEGGENAFNIFDNKVGGGNDKWCCDDPTPDKPVWVAVQFPNPVSLTYFTVTSGNDSPDRDPTDWAIQGSDDGGTYTDIYHMTVPGTDAAVPWTARNQVVKFTLPEAAPAYRYIRYIAYVTPGTLHQINEIEYFGNVGSAEVAYYSGIVNGITTFGFSVNDSGASVVDENSVKLKLDGADVPLGTLTKVDGKIDVAYTAPSEYLPKSVHTYEITAKDAFGNTIKTQGSFTTQDYARLTTELAINPDLNAPGFMWNVHQNNSFQANDNDRPLQQLAGLLGINQANPDAQGVANGPGIPNDDPNLPIHFEIETVINMSQTGGDNNGNFKPDDQMPGIPGTTSGKDGIAGEILTFIELPAGATTMIVNSDDGFRTTAGNVFDVFQSKFAGEFAGGRGASDTQFTVYAQTAGVYAFRTIWEEGGGGANIEWLTVKPDGTRVLINDLANGGLPAYRVAIGGGNTVISSVTPTPNANTVGFDTPISATITDGADAVDVASVVLSLDGVANAAKATKTGGKTTISFQPASFLASGSTHTASITFKAGANTRTETWSFKVAPYVTLTAAHQATSVDKTAPGFVWNVFQNETFTHTSLKLTEDALAGVLSNNGTPVTDNFADPAKINAAIGEGVPGPHGLVHFEIDNVINLSQNAGDNNGNFTPDVQMPGIPGTSNRNDGIDAEVIAFVELPAGPVTLGVNSDDGFRTSAGFINVPSDALNLGEFDGGRGASDTIFKFLVEKAGIYPIRTIWNEGGGGANIEIFSVKADGTKVLLNDTANGGFATYRVGVAPDKGGNARPSLSVKVNTDGSITVTFEGVLEVSDKIDGPYTPLTGVTSPLTITADQPTRFARARR